MKLILQLNTSSDHSSIQIIKKCKTSAKTEKRLGLNHSALHIIFTITINVQNNTCLIATFW